MSASETSNGTPRQTLTTEEELGENFTLKGHAIQETKVTDNRTISPPNNPEPLSLLVESQRLQREMLRVEMVWTTN